MLEVAGLTAGYVPGLPILRQVSLTVPEASLTAIIGPNGAGKSTLVKAVAGLVPVEGGTVRLAGRDITGIRPDRMARAGVAYVPQSDNIFRGLTVRQNLDLALRAHPGAARGRVAELEADFPVLADKARVRAGALSGGQRQMLAVAMALAGRPRLILMDEPSAGLSPRAAEEVLDLARGLTARGVTVLLVEQNVKQALKRADHCYILAEGRNQVDGPPADLMADGVVAKIYLGHTRMAPA
ncbi:ABC transporter ATP-binding protein [Rhodobacteraceae bacterium CCMM004]|nr:ABC transporter ATP-binding protein [Rhodobacteraceae bacterium CCMM004]